MNEIIPLDFGTRESIIYAVKNHSLNLKAPDYISICLWDADRTRLARECGYYPKFFTSQRAQKVAAGRAAEYLEFMRQNMSARARGIIEFGENY